MSHFAKDGEHFNIGDYVVRCLKPEPLHGIVTACTPPLLVITLVSGPVPAHAIEISRNINIYGYNREKDKIALW